MTFGIFVPGIGIFNALTRNLIKQRFSERLANLYYKGVPSYRHLGTLDDLLGVGIFEPLKGIDNTFMWEVKVLLEASEYLYIGDFTFEHFL